MNNLSNKFLINTSSLLQTTQLGFLLNEKQLQTESLDDLKNVSLHGVAWSSQSWYGYAQDRLSQVNSHWLEFPPQSKIAHEFLAVLYILIMTAGITGNFLVIYMFIRCKSLQSPANILVTNLAVSDILMMLKMPLFIFNSMNSGVPLNEISCKIYGFIGGLSGTVSISTLSCIALDRYYVIVYPLNRSNTKLRSKISIAVCWIYGTIFASLPIVHPLFGTYVPEGFLTSCSFDYLTSNDSIRYFILGYFFAAWIIPFCIISFCYSKIIRVVLQARNIGNKLIGPAISSRHCKEQKQMKKEIKLALVVLGIIGLWFAAWTPYAIIALLGITGHRGLITPLSSMIPALFCKTASCLDPFVYAVSNQKFKEELKASFCVKCLNRLARTNAIWATNLSHQPTMRCSLNSEEGVEEIIIMVDIPDKKCPVETKKFVLKKELGCSMVQPVDNNIENYKKLSNVGQTKRTSWIIRPNFSNRTSSLRNMARTWNKSREPSIEMNLYLNKYKPNNNALQSST